MDCPLGGLTQARLSGFRGFAPRRFAPVQNTYKPSVFFGDETGNLSLHRPGGGPPICFWLGRQGAIQDLHADDGENIARIPAIADKRGLNISVVDTRARGTADGAADWNDPEIRSCRGST